jgi:hypothetical protein
LLTYVHYCLANNVYFDLSIRVLRFIIAKYEYQLFASDKILRILRKINSVVKVRLGSRQKMLGYNMTALKFILKEMSYTEIKEVDLQQLKVF